MTSVVVPKISECDLEGLLSKAHESPRLRYPRILHNQGDEFNRVLNFMLNGSYMEPHLHSGVKKIEDIYLLKGKLSVIFFDNLGKVENTTLLEKRGDAHIQIPAFTWHTYVILSEYAVTYETMMGKYDPSTWKDFPNWAPKEGTPESKSYLLYLKNNC